MLSRIYLEITNICNRSCAFCPGTKRPARMLTPEEFALVSKARKYIAAYEDMAELIRLGAYKSGSNRGVDEAIFYYPKIEEFLSQKKGEKFTLDEGYRLLKEILDTPYTPPNAAKG